MRFRLLLNKVHQQPGFTLVEMVAGLAITGILLVGISNILFQFVTINANSSSGMTATKQVENTIDSIRRDALMAQKIIPDTVDASGFPLRFEWITWSNAEYIVTYTLNPDGHLVRTQSIDGQNASKVLALDISSIRMLDAGTYSGGKIELEVTSHPEDIRSVTEIRTFVIFPRPSQ